MPKPNFLIIGAPKAGTTSLYFYLKQHPQIYMCPIKEPDFFSWEGATEGPLTTFGRIQLPQYSTDWEAYCALFKDAGDALAIGDVSPTYLYHPKAPERIEKYLPNVKMVAVLRNPVDRAYSEYLMAVRDGIETARSFAEALELGEKRAAEGGWAHWYHYKRIGLYGEQLERYYRLFSKDQIKVFLFEDLQQEPLRVLRDIFTFLGVDPDFVPNISQKHNPYGVPRFRWLQQWLLRPSKLKNIFLTPIRLTVPEAKRKELLIRILRDWNIKSLPRPKLDPELRKQLVEYYRKDIFKLQDLIGRDLSHWLRVEEGTER